MKFAKCCVFFSVYQAMDKVQKSVGINCSISSSELFDIDR
jgi:hypothetical protein